MKRQDMVIGGATVLALAVLAAVLTVSIPKSWAQACWGCYHPNSPNGPNSPLRAAIFPDSGTTLEDNTKLPNKAVRSTVKMGGETIEPFQFPLPPRWPGLTDDEWVIRRANYAYNCANKLKALGLSPSFFNGGKPKNHDKFCAGHDEECFFCFDCTNRRTCGELPGLRPWPMVPGSRSKPRKMR